MRQPSRIARLVALVALDNTVIRPAYRETNLLNTLDASLRGAADLTKPGGG